MKISTPILLGQEDNLYYVAHLISNYLNPLDGFVMPPQSSVEVEEFSNFTKKLILTNVGLRSDDNAALADFIENFQLLYPHLCNAGGKAFYWANLSDHIQRLREIAS